MPPEPLAVRPESSGGGRFPGRAAEMPALGPEEVVNLLRRVPEVPQRERGVCLRRRQRDLEVGSNPRAVIGVNAGLLSDSCYRLQEILADNADFAVGPNEPLASNFTPLAVAIIVFNDQWLVVGGSGNNCASRSQRTELTLLDLQSQCLFCELRQKPGVASGQNYTPSLGWICSIPSGNACWKEFALLDFMEKNGFCVNEL